jgi:hypothetical protein
VLALVLAGCGGDEDVTQDQFQEDLYTRVNGADADPDDEGADTVMPEAVAACITEKVFAEWGDDQAEINRIYRAADEDELGNETRDTLSAFNQQCYVAEGGAEAPDTTTTTEAEPEADDAGDGATTTEAPTTTEG